VFGEDLHEFDTVSVTANSPVFWETRYSLTRMQFKFDTAATVTLEVNFE